MGLFTRLTLDDAIRLGERYGLEVVEVEALQAGSVNSNFVVRTRDRRKYFARIYEEQGPEGAARELRLLNELCDAGVPTTRPLSPLGAATLPAHSGKPFAVYPWVDGTILCYDLTTPAHCGRVGEALARLHLASHRVSAISAGRFGVDSLGERLDGIEAASNEFGEVARTLRRLLSHYAARRDVGLPVGIVHGDLFRDNVLWDGDRIAALIDFESACRGPFMFDVMTCIEAWCFGDGFDGERVEALLVGYDTVRPMSSAEIDALVVEGALVALRFATTRITDFSMRTAPGDQPERDYRRFLSRLESLEHGALDPALGKLRAEPRQ